MDSVLKKPRRRRKRSPSDLWYATDFLNRQKFDDPDSPWASYVSGGAAKKKRLIQRAEEFQRKVRLEVETALQPPREAGLRKLVDEIEKLKLLRIFEISRGGNSVLNFGDEKFAVEELVGSEQSSLEAAIYLMLAVALRTGGFALLKKCRQCSNFFLSYRRKALACSPKCNSEYHNVEGRKKGYFRTKYLEHKNAKEEKARRMRDDKFSLPEIMRKTGLTKLALIRAGIEVEEEQETRLTAAAGRGTRK